MIKHGGVMFKNQQLKVNDIKINYNEAGVGETVLLLHGNSQNGRIFREIFRQLAQKFHVVAIDSRGHGLSESGEMPFTIEQFAEDILSFCHKKKLKNIVVIGYSDGANIGLYLNHLAPGLITKLISISGNYQVQGIKKWFRLCVFILANCAKILALFSKKMQQYYWKLELIRKDIGLQQRDFKEMSQPTLFLTAQNDLIYMKHTIELHNSIANSQLFVVKNSNHFNILSKKEAYVYIEKFLDITLESED